MKLIVLVVTSYTRDNWEEKNYLIFFLVFTSEWEKNIEIKNENTRFKSK